MAVKLTVHEKCPRCGQRAARKVGNFIKVWHECAEKIPGPQGPPRRFHVDEVIFEPADFTPDQYRAELDAAWREVDDLWAKLHAAERAAGLAASNAVRGVYAPVPA